MAQEIIKSTGFKVVVVIAIIVIIIGFVTNWTFKFKKYAMGGRAAEGNPVIHPVPNPVQTQVQVVATEVISQSPLCNEIMNKINSTQNQTAKAILTNLYNVACAGVSTGRSNDFCAGVAGAREQLCTGEAGTRDMCQFVNGIWNKYCATQSRISGNDPIACSKKCDPLKDDNTKYRECMAQCTNG